ncbi:ABC transporter ATP-binding protein [Actinopolymorpha pittospori]|uniref:Iron complex transport system ATP-binding protein n=1 Tax=Actinopolymorpha pittospori TaxID=648752 RepID=A0A927MNE7_9ACTN|nr:ABC transporter ATP-binding protein [Actinopolymorpha pittospori]MBE1603906.1 iron complex transport system ATP-binding protein [Actinopolymorpha pittospori]
MKLSLAGVSVEIDSVPIVTGADLDVAKGEKVGLVGPNGSGKTTLLRAIYRSLRLVRGTVLLDGQDVSSLRQREVARRSALVAQETASDFDFSVEDVVALGRAPYQRAFDRESAADRQAIAEGLERVGMASYRIRAFATLSGGEKQRVLLARALAQETDLLLLDEPTNHLDVNAALDLLELVRRLDLSTLCVLHDLNLAAAYCDRVCVLQAGRVVAIGPPADVLTESLIHDVFSVHAHRLTHPSTGRLLLAFSAGEGRRAPDETGVDSGTPQTEPPDEPRPERAAASLGETSRSPSTT